MTTLLTSMTKPSSSTPFNPQQGVATMNFGVASDLSVDGAVAVSAPTIPEDANVWAWIEANETTECSPDEHIMASTMLDFVCSAPVANQGFTIFATVREGTLSGRFKISWRWL